MIIQVESFHNTFETGKQLQSMPVVYFLQSLSRKIDLRAVSLVNLGEKDISQLGENLLGFIAPSAQASDAAVRSCGMAVTILAVGDAETNVVPAHNGGMHEKLYSQID